MDIAYGAVFVIIALATYFLYAEGAIVQLVATAFVLLWGTRLSVRIFLKNKGKQEDWRYHSWRIEWSVRGRWYFLLRSYIQIYLIQGFIIFLVSLPVVLINVSPYVDWNIASLFGVAVWIVGFLFETIADFQLDRFMQNPANKGRIMTEGLFRYSRRPNYFGESTMWWGMALIALSNPFAWVAVVSPAVITYIVVSITGPLLERGWRDNPEYQSYKAKTSYFIPWFPKA